MFRKISFSKILLLLFLGGCSIQLFAQNDRIDSLLQVIPKTTNDSVRLRLINEVAFYYVFNDQEKSLAMLNVGLEEASEKGLTFCLNELTNTKGIYFDVLGVKDSARYYLESSLELSKEYGYKVFEKMTLNSLGLYYWNSSNFNEALDSFFKALEINQEYFESEKVSEANYKSNIGLIYQELKQFNKAIEYHQSALNIRDSLGLTSAQSISHANLGVCFKSLKMWEEAEAAYFKAQELAMKSGNTRLYYSLNDNLGNLYVDTEEYDKAIDLLLKALDRPEAIGQNPKTDLSIYSNLTAAFTFKNNPKEALKYAKLGFEVIQNDSTLRNFASTLYKHAAESNYMIGNMDEGRRLINKFIAVNDSLFAEENVKALASLEIKFKTKEKEAELAKAQRDIAQRELQIERQNLLIYGSAGVIAVILVIGSLLYRQQKLKNLQLIKDAELAEARTQIVAQKQLNEQRSHIAKELHDNIGTYLTFMKTSLEKWQDSSVNNRVKEVIQLMKKTATELRHTVWILNNESITLEEIVLRLRDLMQFNQQDVSLSADVIGNDQLSLNNIQSTHLIRLIQEAINNALKHSGCTQVDVLLYGNETNISFEVRDNGVGFDLSNKTDGNGILNMQYRMNKLGGEFNLETAPSGTRISGSFSIGNFVISSV